MTLQGNDNDEEIMKRVRDDIGAEGLHVHVLHTIHVHVCTCTYELVTCINI